MNDIVKSEAKNEIVVYQPNETMRLEVQLRDDSIWLSQQKIADLFGVQKAAISKHLKNIYASGELMENTTVSKMETVRDEGDREVTRTIEGLQAVARPLPHHRQHGLAHRSLAQGRRFGALRDDEDGTGSRRHPFLAAVMG